MSTEFEIIIAGGGIAGFSAALTAARLGRKALVLTGDMLGGHLLTIDKVDGYPGFPEGVPGYDLCPIAQEQAETAGAEIAMASVSALERAGESWRVTTREGTYDARCVIVATGTRLRTLGVQGEDLLRGKGVSHCASCDAPLLRGKAVVVAGGGDSALQEALTLAAHCASVTIVHHGGHYTAQAAYVGAVEQDEKIKPVPDSEIAAILGTDAVEGVRINHLKAGDVTELECAGVFVFVGLQANTDFIHDRSTLDADAAIVTDAALRTRSRGLLAAGTVRSGSACRAAAAAGDGAVAARSADCFLRNGQWPEAPG